MTMTWTDDIRAKYQPAAGSAMDRTLRAVDAATAAEETLQRERDAVVGLQAAAQARLDEPAWIAGAGDPLAAIDAVARSITISLACDHIKARMERAILDAGAATAEHRRALSVMTS